MLILVSNQSVAYYALLSIFWPMFIMAYYVIPAYMAPLFMKYVFKVAPLDVRHVIVGGLWGFFFALPFVQVFSNHFQILFVILVRSLLVFVLASMLFQFLFLYNTVKLSLK